MKVYKEVDTKLHIFLALDSSQWSAECSDRFVLVEKAPSTHWIEGLVGPRGCLAALDNQTTLAPDIYPAA
jgi:hypothetical protein